MERRGFGTAAADLGISRTAATAAIQDLERNLGVRLLHRTTRQVRPTAEGEVYYARCATILADLEDADRAASGTLAGILRVDVAGSLARLLLLPALPDFLARYPLLTVHLGEGERFVDLVHEGIDCVVRAGRLADSGLIARSLGTIEEVTCASPAYLAAHGVPTSPRELSGHEMVGFVSSRTGQILPLEFTIDGEVVNVELPAPVRVSAADTSAAAARFGLGLVQAPRLRFADDLASGALVEVLADYPPSPTPVSVLYPGNRQVSPRLRVFLDWLTTTMSHRLSSKSRTSVTPTGRDGGASGVSL